MIREEWPQEMTAEDFNREFEEINRELNEYLAKELIQSTLNDEIYHYDKY